MPTEQTTEPPTKELLIEELIVTNHDKASQIERLKESEERLANARAALAASRIRAGVV